MKADNTVRIGAGTSDDRLVPALELAERSDIDDLVFECLGERTVSRENLSRSRNPKRWDSLERELTTERVAEAFRHIAKGPIRRMPLRNLKAFNFVIENAFGGGVTVSLAQDIHGNSLSNVMLAIELPYPEAKRA